MKNLTFLEDGDDSFAVFTSTPTVEPKLNIRRSFFLLTAKGIIETKGGWINRGKFLFDLAKDNLIAMEVTYDSEKKEVISEELTPVVAPDNIYNTPRIEIVNTQKLWRYLSIQKLTDLISSSQLYLCRIDRFSDNLEGISPEACIKLLEADKRFDEIKLKSQIEVMKKRFDTNRNSTFTSCWNINGGLDVDLWNDYSNNGFCLETDFESLQSALSAAQIPIHFEPIRYFQEPYFNQEAYWFPTVFKRWKFRHEQELRVSTYGVNLSNFTHIKPKIDLNKLIKAIHIHPNCSQYNINRLKKMLKKSGLKVPVKKYTKFSENPTQNDLPYINLPSRIDTTSYITDFQTNYQRYQEKSLRKKEL
jgi:hypothetical protein